MIWPFWYTAHVILLYSNCKKLNCHISVTYKALSSLNPPVSPQTGSIDIFWYLWQRLSTSGAIDMAVLINSSCNIIIIRLSDFKSSYFGHCICVEPRITVIFITNEFCRCNLIPVSPYNSYRVEIYACLKNCVTI